MIIIPGPPIPNKRSRSSRKTNKHYNPQKREQLYIGCLIKKQFNSEPLLLPCALDITFFMPIPKSFTKKQRDMIKKGKLLHKKKPDIDNMEILILNCMTGVVYKDDAQVYKVNKEKKYDENPRTEIVIKWQK